MSRLLRVVPGPLWLAGPALLLAACSSALAAAPPILPVLPTALATLPPVAATRPPVPTEASPTPGHTAEPEPTWTATPVATQTPVLPTRTPTAVDRAEPTLGAFNITPIADATLVTPHPTAVPAVELAETVVNVLLIGTDRRAGASGFRTDTLIIVSINRESSSVSLLSIPRDLYVYIPKYGMGRINQAYSAARSNGFPGGGPALLEQTILYNLGIPIHFYALANFDGFRQIVDTLGGIDIPVNCQVTEYKLKDPTLDAGDAANYELYTQPVGVAHMDGTLALWYARVRPVGGDFFRGYRQRQVLRAIYRQALSTNVIPQIPALYTQIQEIVETDMGVWDVMQFAPLTAQLDEGRVRSLHIGPNHTLGWRTPSGEAVLLPKPESLLPLVNDFLSHPVDNRLERPATWVEVVNGAPGTAHDLLAAETLRNEGFAVRRGEAPAEPYAETVVMDYTTSSKGSQVKKLQYYLHLDDQHVIAQPDPNSPVQFRVILGANYNPCPRADWMDPALLATPTPAP